MKSTGVVRKIDHLGRIVIPKEIRKSLRIKDGENMEIYVDADTILLKKSSSLSGFQDAAQNFVEVASSLLHKNLLITDLDEVIACNLQISKQYLHQEITSEYLQLLNKRETYVANHPASISFTSKLLESVYYLLIPIVVQGDLFGSILLFSSDEITEEDKLVVKFLLKFLEKTLEE